MRFVAVLGLDRAQPLAVLGFKATLIKPPNTRWAVEYFLAAGGGSYG